MPAGNSSKPPRPLKTRIVKDLPEMTVPPNRPLSEMVTENHLGIWLDGDYKIFVPQRSFPDAPGFYFTKNFTTMVAGAAAEEEQSPTDVRILDIGKPMKTTYSALRALLPREKDLLLYHVRKLLDEHAHGETAGLSQGSRNIVPFGPYVILIEHSARKPKTLLTDAIPATQFRLQPNDRVLHRF